MRNIYTKEERDGREKIRSINEAKLYRYKVAFDTVLEYLHKDVDMNSVDIEDSVVSVENTTLKGFQQYVCGKIDEHDKLSTGRKNKGKIF